MSLTSPILTYDASSNPFPLQASAESGALTVASIDMLATNGTGDDQVLDHILIEFPVGNEANSMTPDPTAIEAHAPPHWTTRPIQIEGYVRYLFQPEPGYATLPSGDSLTLSFFNIPVNRLPGTFSSIITESTGDCGDDCPSITIPFTKFPSGWGSVAFWAEPANVPDKQGNTTLKWRGPQGATATYTIEYLDKSNGQVVHLPQSGKPPFSNNGEYPDQGNPALTLISDTTFTLSVSLVINKVLETAREQVMVSVGRPTPRILIFKGRVSAAGDGSLLALELKWEIDQADQVQITHVDGLLPLKGSTVIQPKYGFSLASSYTLKATNKTQIATSTVNITWTPSIHHWLGNRPVNECAISPDGQLLFVSCNVKSDEYNGYNFDVLNPMTLDYITYALKIPDPPPDFIAPSPDNSRVYLLQHPDDYIYPVLLAGYDTSSLRSGGLRQVQGSPVVLPSRIHPFMLAVTPNNDRVYVSSLKTEYVLVFDVSMQNFMQIAQILVGGQPRGIAFNKDGKLAFVAKSGAASVAVIETATLTVIDSVDTGSTPIAVAVSPDGRRLYVGNQGSKSVSVFEFTDRLHELSGSPIAVSGGPSQLATSPDGTLLFVICSEPYCLNIIDTARLTLVQSIPTETTPKSMAVSPDGIRVYLLFEMNNDPIWIYVPTLVGGTMSAQ
jgi:YVTN family beta-propeller protein